MSLANVFLEQIGTDRWVGHLEAGNGANFRRHQVRGSDLLDVTVQVLKLYNVVMGETYAIYAKQQAAAPEVEETPSENTPQKAEKILRAYNEMMGTNYKVVDISRVPPATLLEKAPKKKRSPMSPERLEQMRASLKMAREVKAAKKMEAARAAETEPV